MALLRDSMEQIFRGNRDFEALGALSFYLTCRYRYARMSVGEISAYQTAKARNIVRYAVRHSPFFKRYYTGYDLDDVWHLPPINKKLMMANLSEYNTLGLSREEILQFCLEVERTRDFSRRYKGLNIGLSSGTSGNKGVEILTPREEGYLRAALLARFPKPPGKINLAFILRVSTPAFNLNVLGHRLTYVSQLAPLKDICAQLNHIDPNIVSGPASMLRLLAHQQTELTPEKRRKR